MSTCATPPTSRGSTSRPRYAPRSRRAATAWSSDPRDARFVLQANVLQAGRSSPTAAEVARGDGFGGTLLGGAAGGAAGYGLGAAGIGVNNTVAAIGGALAGAAIAGLADAYVQDTTYTIVTDVQVSERAPPGVVVSQSEQASLQPGHAPARSARTAAAPRTPSATAPAIGQHRQQGEPRLGRGRAAARGRDEPQHRRHLLGADASLAAA